jgi:hypothetical protein
MSQKLWNDSNDVDGSGVVMTQKLPLVNQLASTHHLPQQARTE